MKITRGAWQKYITVLRKLNSKATEDMAQRQRALRRAVEAGEISSDDAAQALTDYAYAIATKYGEGAAAASCEMYDAVAELQGARVPAAVPAQTATYGEAAKTVYGVMKQSQEQVPAAVGRLVKQAGVDTTMHNAIRDGAEWAWIPSGDSCAFCLVLASQGWVRASKKVLDGDHASHIHNHCDCTFAIRFDGKSTVEGYDPDALRAQYDAAEGNTPQEKINSMRRDHYAANKDAINAQKRAAYAARKARGTVANGGGGGIIKPLDIDDLNVASYGKEVKEEVINFIHENVTGLEENNGFVFSEVFVGSIQPDENGIPILQTEMMSNGLLRLKINTDVVAGKTVDELDQRILNSKNTVCSSLKEALIHESGHAKLIWGLKPEEVEALYKRLGKKHVKGISKIARNDGVEAIAEIEVFLSRGDEVNSRGKKLYRRNMR